MARQRTGSSRASHAGQRGTAVACTSASVKGEAASSRYPLLWYEFEDGLFVIAADRRLEALVGHQITQIGEYSVTESVARVRRITRGDNEFSRKSIGAFALRKPFLMMGLGLAQEDGTLPLTVRGPDGEDRVIAVRPYAPDQAVDWVFARPRVGPLGPLAYRDRAEELDTELSDLSFARYPRSYWFEPLPRLDALYLKLNLMASDPQDPFGGFIERFFQAVDRGSTGTLIIDLRNNGGGDGTIVLPLLHGIIQRPEINRHGHLFTVIGRNTFSASMIFAGFLERHTENIFVGEPSGGATIHFGDPETVTLPNSGLQFRISRYKYQNSWPWDRHDWITPHLVARTSSSDFFANRDVAMEAIEQFINDPWVPIADYLRQLIDEGLNSGSLSARYRDYIRTHPDSFGESTEEDLNRLGYELLGDGRIDLAVSVFTLNVGSFPNSGNAWDSLAEAHWASGDLAEAARHYRKSLELNPKNENARRMLSEIEDARQP